MSDYLEISSRIRSALTDGEAPSGGASCNTFVVEDRVLGTGGISDSIKWATEIVYYQGAPTLILSKLRSDGTPLSTGGTASGPCSFARIYDTVVDVMRRPTKKNSVAVAFLDADHPDIRTWISYEFQKSLTRLYCGVLFREGVTYDPKLLEDIAHSYNTWGISYLCKIRKDDQGEWLYPNVCTEIRQRHLGQCILGAIKLHELPAINPKQYAYDIGTWTNAFRESMIQMNGYLSIAAGNSKRHPELFSYEPQIGLGFVGFANALGKFGATYAGLAEYLPLFRMVAKYQDEQKSLDTLIHLLTLAAKRSPEDPNLVFLTALVAGIKAGTEVADDLGMTRVWTQQPTTHTSLRLRDGKFSVAAEIQPPYAVRGSDGLSRARQVSALRGDNELTYPDTVETRDDVPYAVYYKVSCLIQYLFDITGHSHTLSHCYYGEKFTRADLRSFLSSPLMSLYYRLPSTPASTFAKDRVPDDVGTLDSVQVEEDDFLSMLGQPVTDAQPSATCSLKPGECESCTM